MNIFNDKLQMNASDLCDDVYIRV